MWTGELRKHTSWLRAGAGDYVRNIVFFCEMQYLEGFVDLYVVCYVWQGPLARAAWELDNLYIL